MTNDYVYDNYEISGCCKIGDGDDSFVEPCGDDDAHFWTLYGHITGHGVEAIGDFKSRDAAEHVYRHITGQYFTGSYEANGRLQMMHAAPDMLAACRLVVDRWEHGDLAEAARACGHAIARATAAPPWEADESWSVLLLYPDYANDSGTETFYVFVKASDPLTAVADAQHQAMDALAGVDGQPDDFVPLLVTQGHHPSEPLFNK